MTQFNAASTVRAAQKDRLNDPLLNARMWRKRNFLNHLAKRVVQGGGAMIIASVLGLMLLFAVVIWPLWQKTSVGSTEKVQPPALDGKNILAVSADEYEQAMHLLTADGMITFYNFAVDTQFTTVSLPLEEGEELTSAWRSTDAETFAVGTSFGRILQYSISFNSRFLAGRRDYAPDAEISDPVQLIPAAEKIIEIAGAFDSDGGLVIAALTGKKQIVLYRKAGMEDDFFDEEETAPQTGKIENLSEKPVKIAIGEGGSGLFVGFENGSIEKYEIDDLDNPVRSEKIQVSTAAITLLSFMLGDRSLVIGNQAGEISVWFESFNHDGTGPRQLRRAHTMTAHAQAISSFSVSQRNRSFVAGSADGVLSFQHATNERLLWMDTISDHKLKLLTMTPKNTAIIFVDAENAIYKIAIDSPHPEASLKAFFSKIWYEGYAKPEYVWQSSSGSDDFEPKLSLIPLIFGTIKGTFYALVFALPIAVLAAIYVSQFMHWSVKSVVKPAMEIMAALPSVVVGFIGGLWLAPRMQPVVPGVIAVIIFVPTVAILFSLLWRKLMKLRNHNLISGSETFILIPVVLITAYLYISGSGVIESRLFGGDYELWLKSSLQISYDQRNAFVVGLVMGFAVIPIIFTIAEDALSNVPRRLSAASLALGATPWQTARHIVLPSASPGIFSAAMFGLGRAVGETMIVLMATGNTPVMDWNIFNGFRTLSANIAVEIPEAPMGGTLFRTLFFAALLLFGMTFIVNTGAELVRQSVQKKYGKHE